MGLTSLVVVDARGVFRRGVSRWGAANRRSFPWRETDDPFRILVAEVLLQRSRGSTVTRVYRELFRRWPDAASLGRARVRTIENVIRPLGLVRRASSLRNMAREIERRGAVPTSVEELLTLPGVGPYAAGATAAVAFDAPAPVVDGVTARVYRRYFGLEPSGPPSQDATLWDLVAKATPKEGSRDWNWAVLDLAAVVCLPRSPRCHVCPLRSTCVWANDET